jgi:xylulokinase
MNYYMGVDIGTSGCKAVLFDDNGNQRKSAYREYNIISAKAGWAELDSDEVINKCFEVIREAASFVPEGSVKGIGISSQGEAFTLIDENGKALTNAFVSSDIRAVNYVKKWPVAFGEDRLYRITGHTPHPMFSLFKLLWIRENMPEKWRMAYKILCFEDLLQYRLGIKDPAIGWSLAGRTMLFDVINHCWNKDILESVGINETQLSRPLPSGKIAGYINTMTARSLSIDGNIPIVSGGHDQPCSALGAGATASGVAVYASGTVDCITPAFKDPIFSPQLQKSNLCTYDHAAPGMYATIAFSLTGGNILKWFRNEFGKEETEESVRLNCNPYDLLLKQMPENPSNLLVLPYFTPSGTPYFDTKTKGAILGLDLSTTRAEIMKALLEGVALEMRLNLDILEQSGYRINELRAIGGGAKSKAWIQLKADIFQKPITITGITEAGCMGVAMLAASAVTGSDVFKLADKWIKQGTVIQPRASKIYDKKFLLYKKLYKKLSSITLPSIEYLSKREL